MRDTLVLNVVILFTPSTFVSFASVFEDRFSLCKSSGSPGMSFTDHANLKLTDICCLYVPSTEIKSVNHHQSARYLSFLIADNGS